MALKRVPQQVVVKRGEDGRDGIDGVDGRNGRDGVGIMGPRGPQGEQGPPGEKGEKGDMPDHQVSNGEVRFEKPDGTWGKWIEAAKTSTAGGGGGVDPAVVEALDARVDALELLPHHDVLDDLSDVDVTSPSDGDLLTYETSSGTWKAVPPATTGTPTQTHSGTITVDEVWDTDFIHHINGNLDLRAKLTVNAGVTVQIDGGVTVTLGGGGLNGRMEMNGTPTSPIICEGLGANAQFDSSFYRGDVEWRYVEFRSIEHFMFRPRASSPYFTRVFIGNCTFIDCGRVRAFGFDDAIGFIAGCTFLYSRTAYTQNIYWEGALISPKVHNCVCDLGVTSFVENSLVSSSIIRGDSAVITANRIGMHIEECLLENTNSGINNPVLIAFDHTEVHNSILLSEGRVVTPLSDLDKEHVVISRCIIESRTGGQSTLNRMGTRWYIGGCLFLGSTSSHISIFNSGTSGSTIEKNSFLGSASDGHISNYTTTTTLDIVRNNVFGNSNTSLGSTQAATINTLTDNIYWRLSASAAPSTTVDSDYTVTTNTGNSSVDPDIRKASVYEMQEDFGLILTSHISAVLDNVMNKYKVFDNGAFNTDIGHATKRVLG